MEDVAEERKVPPDYWLVKVPCRGFWREDIQEMTTAIWTVYVFDRNLHVHICSLTPSYELHFAGYDYIEVDGLLDEVSNDLNEMIVTAESELIDYSDVSTIDRIIEANPQLAKQVDWNLDPDSDPFQEIAEAWCTGSATF